MKILIFIICLMSASFYKARAGSETTANQENPSGGILLKSPASITPQAVEEKIDILPLDMSWSGKTPLTEERWSIGFSYQKGQTVLKLQFIGAFPDGISSEIKEKFSKTIENGQEVWTYLYGNLSLSPEKPRLNPSHEEEMGTVGEPLMRKGSPKSLTTQKLGQALQKKRAIFYTGAGISAGVVPTMPQIMEKIGLGSTSRSTPLLDLVKRIFTDPKTFKEPMDDFYKSCIYGTPTLAHITLKEIPLLKNWGVLTENLDLLHQRSGIEPLNHLMPNWLKFNISQDDLRKIDMVITIGLQSDESGFLGWYKKINPKGTIIAVNKNQPSYMGDDDFILLGDAQVILPELLTELKK